MSGEDEFVEVVLPCQLFRLDPPEGSTSPLTQATVSGFKRRIYEAEAGFLSDLCFGLARREVLVARLNGLDQAELEAFLESRGLAPSVFPAYARQGRLLGLFAFSALEEEPFDLEGNLKPRLSRDPAWDWVFFQPGRELLAEALMAYWRAGSGQWLFLCDPPPGTVERWRTLFRSGPDVGRLGFDDPARLLAQVALCPALALQSPGSTQVQVFVHRPWQEVRELLVWVGRRNGVGLELT
ncbi:MAG: hypothetical protein HY335_10205 [Deinococcus sp.]|nr:hypothetical protein [Deinococcus sp.]